MASEIGNVPYLFVLQMKDRTLVELARNRETTLVQREGVTFVVVRLLNPRMIKRFSKEHAMNDMEPPQDYWQLEEREYANQRWSQTTIIICVWSAKPRTWFLRSVWFVRVVAHFAQSSGCI